MAKARTPLSVAMAVMHYVDVPGYPDAHSPYSHAVVANGFVFVWFPPGL
jgi:enamine deaminase RidA (YjgF/YER057c/UK114 family)